MTLSNSGIPATDASSAMSALLVNPNVAALPPYNAGMSLTQAQAASGHVSLARLASNENPDGCAPGVLTALGSGAFEPWRYCDPSCSALRGVLSDKLGIEAGLIVVGNGSEEMIAAICRGVLVPGAQVLTVQPSFGLHEIEPLAAGATVLKVPMTNDAAFDVPALEAALAAGPHAVFLSSPWNPVGASLGEAALRTLIAAVRPGTLFVLDEAYFEFADDSSPDGIEILRGSGIAYVVLRTFSKAYGLAGLRVGYAVCSHPEIAKVVAAAKTPFNVNGAAQIAAVAALDDEAWMKNSVCRIRKERDRVSAALRTMSYSVASSQTNFLFFDTRRQSSDFAEALLMEGVIVKPWREKGYQTWLRASIGSPAENDRLIAAVSKQAVL